MNNNNQFDSQIFNEVLTYDGLDTDTSKELHYPFPCCNHVNNVTEYNAGYTRGFLNDDIPFEAEFFANDEDEIWLAVVMPAALDENMDSMNFESSTEREKVWNRSILANNMKALGICDDFLLEYNNLLIENGLFIIDDGRVPGVAKYFLDGEDNLIVQVFVELKDGRGVLNYSDLDIVEF